jgi:hypothetical protein
LHSAVNMWLLKFIPNRKFSGFSDDRFIKKLYYTFAMKLFSKHNTVIYDWIFWISLVITALWFTLKIIGVIKTPVWVELIPVGSIVFAAGVFFQKVEHISDDLHEFKADMNEFRRDVTAELKEHDRRLVRIEERVCS